MLLFLFHSHVQLSEETKLISIKEMNHQNNHRRLNGVCLPVRLRERSVVEGEGCLEDEMYVDMMSEDRKRYPRRS